MRKRLWAVLPLALALVFCAFGCAKTPALSVVQKAEQQSVAGEFFEGLTDLGAGAQESMSLSIRVDGQTAEVSAVGVSSLRRLSKKEQKQTNAADQLNQIRASFSVRMSAPVSVQGSRLQMSMDGTVYVADGKAYLNFSVAAEGISMPMRGYVPVQTLLSSVNTVLPVGGATNANLADFLQVAKNCDRLLYGKNGSGSNLKMELDDSASSSSLQLSLSKSAAGMLTGISMSLTEGTSSANRMSYQWLPYFGLVVLPDLSGYPPLATDEGSGGGSLFPLPL